MMTIALTEHDQLLIPGERNPYVYFIGEGVVSIAAASGTRRIEIAMVGPEGAVGLDRSEPHCETTLLFPGKALRILRKDLSAAVAASTPLRDLLDRYRAVLDVEIAQSAVADWHGKSGGPPCSMAADGARPA